MQLIFFGSDQYSAIVLDKLAHSQHKVVAIVTSSTSDAGAVNILAKTHNYKLFYYPPNITALSKLITSNTYGVTASFGHLLKPDLLQLIPRGVYNIHPSILPQYRNVAPGPYALAMGDQITGVSLFKINDKIDSGQIIIQQKVPILASDNSPLLLTRLFNLGSELLLGWLSGTQAPQLIPVTDPLIFTHKLRRHSAFIEWPVFTKYIRREKLERSDTNNQLITLRLTNFPDRNLAHSVISDLFRALVGYEKLWTITPAGKEVYITSLDPLMLQIPGKPRPISYSDFSRYYL